MHAWLNQSERAAQTYNGFGKIAVTRVVQLETTSVPLIVSDQCFTILPVNVILPLFKTELLQLLEFCFCPFTWGHSPPECALRLISSTVFFLESWSDRDTNTGLMYLINAAGKQERHKNVTTYYTGP